MGCLRLTYNTNLDLVKNEPIKGLTLNKSKNKPRSANIYGFNGKLKDNEIKGAGNSYDFGARMYDPRVARFLSIDPREKDFPYMSPYVYAANNPIRYVDINGEGPGDRVKRLKNRQRNLTQKASTELFRNNGLKTTKWYRIQRRLNRVNEKLNGGNNGLSISKKANFGKGHPDNIENTSLSNTFEYETVSDNFDFNTIGFKAAKINKDGELEVFQVGRISGAGFPPVPRWPKDNKYGQKEGSKVIVEDGNIVDPSGKVLIRLPKGMSPYDGLYQKGDVTSSGEEIESDKVMRTEAVKEINTSGKLIGTSHRRTDVTEEVEEENQ